MSGPDQPPAVLAARSFAVIAHADQRYGEHPYVVHLDEVCDILRSTAEGDARTLRLVIGYLHDVVEDTPVTLAQVEQRFGDDVAGCVDLLTDAPGRNRKERKATTYARLAQVDPQSPRVDALVVKAADRLANVRRCISDGKRGLLRMYRDEHPTFRAAAHRPGLVDELWTELDRLLA